MASLEISSSLKPFFYKKVNWTLSGLLSIFLLSTMTAGCGALASKKYKRKLGMRKQTIKIADLGKQYKKYASTELDYFSHSKKVKKLTRRKPITINFHTFKVKGFDNFIKSSNVVYAQYRYADAVIDRFNAQLKAIFGKKFLKLKSKEVSAAIRKGKASKLGEVRKLKKAYKALLLAFKASKDIVNQSRALMNKSGKLISKGKNSLLKNPKKSLMVMDMGKTSKQALSRLKAVMVGTPKLVKKLSKTKDVIPFLKDIL